MPSISRTSRRVSVSFSLPVICFPSPYNPISTSLSVEDLLPNRPSASGSPQPSSPALSPFQPLQRRTEPPIQQRRGGPKYTSTHLNRHLLREARLREWTVTGGRVEREEKRSFGIGGAGNIRRPTEVIYSPRSALDSIRSSIRRWSATPVLTPVGSGKRGSILGLFGRKVVVDKEDCVTAI